MDKLVSIIVPVYNVEKYVERCLESLISQTYKNLEIIVIDDGSADSSLEKCDKIAKTDGRIKLFSQKNGGVSAARNFGLSVFSGDYVTFVDSDDYVSPVHIEILLKNSVKYGADISVIGSSTGEITDGSDADSYPVSVYDNKKAVCTDINLGVVTRMLFSREAVKGLNFDEKLKIAEDTLFFYTVLDKSQCTVIQSVPSYYIFTRPDSALHIRFDERFLGVITAFERSYEMWMNKYPEYKNLFIKRKTVTYMRIMQDGLLDSSKEAKRVRKIFINEIKSVRLKDIKQYCTKKEYTLLILSRSCPAILKVREQLKKAKIRK